MHLMVSFQYSIETGTRVFIQGSTQVNEGSDGGTLLHEMDIKRKI